MYTLVYTNKTKNNPRLDINPKTCYYLYTLIYTNTDMPNQVNTSDSPKEVIRVSISEAARLFGVNAQTIRRAITAQEVTYIIVAGRYKLNFESLVKWSQKHTTLKNKLEKKGIGQFVGNWKIKNPLYSPNPKIVTNKETAPDPAVPVDNSPTK